MPRKGINYRKVPEGGGDPRLIASVVNLLVDGKMNIKGSVTLTASATTSVVTDYRVGVNSVIVLSPKTAAAATAAQSAYISNVTKNQFTITHASAAATDQTFDYAVLG